MVKPHLFPRAAVAAILTVCPAAVLGFSSLSHCQDYTLDDPCITEENMRECLSLVRDGCEQLLVLESCPLQFQCGDTDPLCAMDFQDDVDAHCDAWISTYGTEGCSLAYSDVCRNDHPLGAQYNEFKLMQGCPLHCGIDPLCYFEYEGEDSCAAWLAKHPCHQTWQDVCPFPHPLGSQYDAYPIASSCPEECNVDPLCTMDLSDQANVCSTWLAKHECSTTWDDVCSIPHPAGEQYNSYPLSAGCPEQCG